MYLIKVNGIKIVIFRSIENRKRIRISFVYKNIKYNLATTDPALWEEFSTIENGEFHLDTEKILCVSLGGKFTDSFCYKLVAAVF